MTDRLKRILRGIGITDYLIREKNTQRAELYYVRRTLDTKRSVSLRDITVCVYRGFSVDGENYLGCCEVIVYPSMTDGEIEKRLLSGYETAAHVKVREYPFACAVRDVREDSVPDIDRIADCCADAVYRADTDTDAYVNSTEIFVSYTYTRLCSSRGVDVGYPSLETSGEIVVGCKGKEDAELYDGFRYEGECFEALFERTRRKLAEARDRASAERSVDVEGLDLVLEGECVRSLIGYAAFLAGAKNIHTGYSSAKAGEKLTGIYPDLTAVPSAPYSREGIAMKERALVRDGILVSPIGDMRFSSYIGAEPTGEYSRIYAESGSTPVRELLSSPCLHVVAFSDFQFDELDGYFGGEVRLGYLYDGERVRAVTGVSVCGNFRTAQHVEYSSERCSDYTYDGPRYVRIYAK